MKIYIFNAIMGLSILLMGYIPDIRQDNEWVYIIGNDEMKILCLIVFALFEVLNLFMFYKECVNYD